MNEEALAHWGLLQQKERERKKRILHQEQETRIRISNPNMWVV
jgi:hypothetical protein